jgi:hypothetical protein
MQLAARRGAAPRSVSSVLAVARRSTALLQIFRTELGQGRLAMPCCRNISEDIGAAPNAPTMARARSRAFPGCETDARATNRRTSFSDAGLRDPDAADSHVNV